MKKYLLLFLMVFSCYVFGDDGRWHSIGVNNLSSDGSGDFISVDLKTAIKGDKPEVWAEIVSLDGVTIKSATQFNAVYNCVTMESAILKIFSVNGNGVKTLDESIKRSNLSFEKALPESSMEKIINYVCQNYYIPNIKK